MKILLLLPLVFGLVLSGCVHRPGPGLRLAQAEPPLCKHCNCYMPADVADEAACPVCDCGYTAEKCLRGK